LAGEMSAESTSAAGAGVFVLMLAVGLVLGMMVQRFLRSGRDLKGARTFAKAAAKTHWRGSFPRLLLWGFVAVCVVLATFRLMIGD
jgi:hypothetical protein